MVPKQINIRQQLFGAEKQFSMALRMLLYAGCQGGRNCLQWQLEGLPLPDGCDGYRRGPTSVGVSLWTCEGELSVKPQSAHKAEVGVGSYGRADRCDDFALDRRGHPRDVGCDGWYVMRRDASPIYSL